MKTTLKVIVRSEPISQPLASIADLSNVPKEVIRGFIGRVKAGAKLFRVDADRLSTGRTGEIGIVFEPSDILLELMAAVGTFKLKRQI